MPLPRQFALRYRAVGRLLLLLLLLPVCLVAAAPVRARTTLPPPPLVIRANQDQYPLGPHLAVLADPAGTLTIDEVSSRAYDDRFAPVPMPTPTYGFTDTVYWACLTIVNDSGRAGSWTLVSDFPNFNRITLYQLSPARMGFAVSEVGNDLPFAEWEIDYHRPAFRLVMAPGEQRTIYLRFENQASMTLDLTLWEQAAFGRATRAELLGLGLWHGMLLTMGLFGLALWLLLRQASYLYFALFLTCTFLVEFTYRGLAYQYLWPTWVGLNQKMVPFLHALSMLLGLQFARSFLGTRSRAPAWDRLLLLLMAGFALGLLLTPLVAYRAVIVPTVYLALVVSLALAGVSLLLWRRGIRVARYFALGWLVYLAVDNLFYLTRLGLLPSFAVTEHAGDFGSGLLVIFLAAAMADQVNLLRREKNQALADVSAVNRVLEARVAERTAELAAINAALRAEIHERSAAEQALRDSRALLQAVLDHAPAVINLVDRAGRFLLVNREAAAMLQRQPGELIGRPFSNFFPPELCAQIWCEYELIRQTGELLSREYIIPLSPGARVFWQTSFPIYAADGELTGFGNIATDITERKQNETARLDFERQLAETQRLESLGVMAGGIAHDFNNILASILGHAELALLDLPAEGDIRHAINQVVTGARRAADLTEQLLAYAGQGRFVTQPLSLNDLVIEIAELLHVSVAAQAELRYELAVDLPLIEADATQIRQIILNLITNAAEAIGPGGGTIVLGTSVAALDRVTLDEASFGADLPAGHYVALIVHDNGSGMSPATLARIFDPFFTTKFTGRGLGLAAVQGIVRKHGGALQVQSALSQGTTFRIWFPCAATGAAPALLSAPDALEPVQPEQAILVVDDDPAVRIVAARMLTRLGYTVEVAAGGGAALAMLCSGIPHLVAVLLDFTMPGENGVEVAHQIQICCPGLPVILISGYTADHVAANYQDLPIAGFVHKPFSFEALRNALDAAVGMH